VADACISYQSFCREVLQSDAPEALGGAGRGALALSTKCFICREISAARQIRHGQALHKGPILLKNLTGKKDEPLPLREFFSSIYPYETTLAFQFKFAVLGPLLNDV
jgi:hypothetical protein